jgi:phosphatidylserine/phosphatidylglycerophosphate/cardiolipin synthase-like enzyme
MPSVVALKGAFNPQAAAPEAAGDVAVMFPEMVGRNCRLEHYTKIDVGSFLIDAKIISYASPDSTFAVTKRLIEGATKSILIGIYDFSAPHVKEVVLQALARGVKVSLMLDIDNDEEQDLFDELASLGVDGVPAPSCASQNDNKFFRSSHEKVIVIDGEWSLIQSGNYSSNSCPFNVVDGGDPDAFAPGNRDSGLAIKSKPLAKFFTKILKSDMDLELNGPQAAGAGPAFEEPAAFLVEAAPKKTPRKLFKSKTHTLAAPLRIQPVLSPDNYMDFVPDRLRAARESILIQQQYIRSEQEHIATLIEAIAEAQSEASDLDVRILLGKIFSARDLPKEKRSLEILKQKCGLKLGRNIRYVNTTRLVHCHNKMVLIDGKGVLVSSQNWSNAAVSENREAGIWLEHKAICTYFTDIFETDWKDGFKTLPDFGPETVTPEALSRGGFIRVQPADYAEV